MAEETVLAWLEEGEGPTRAFLPARVRPQTLAETLVALANERGGHILLGIRGQRHGILEGVGSVEEALARLREAARACTPPLELPEPEVLVLRGYTVLVVEVPAGLPCVYHYRGLYLRRSDRGNVPLNPLDLRRLLLERSEEGFERLWPAGASLDDLDMEQVNAYAARLHPLPVDGLQLLRERGCLAEVDGELRPTYAGLLLFGRNPQAFLPQARILLARYPGTLSAEEPLREEAGGTLPAQVRQAEAFLQAHMRRGRFRLETERVEVTEYPLEAVHEALVNAVAHRDYSVGGDTIQVRMFQDRLEVYSPGHLPGPVTVENIRREHLARNPVLVRVLAEMGLLRQLGYGIPRIFALMEEAHLPAPVLQETPTGFLLTLYGPGSVAPGEFPAEPQALARLGLNERQVQALLYTAEKGRITGREFQELCPEVSGETLRRDLADLIARGLLLKIGERRATYYILK
ncbi:MAG: ATP-binding protein [Chloroflexia bacterium]